MRKTEIEEVMEIEQKELYPELTTEQIKDWMESRGLFAPQCFIATSDGIITGFIVWSPYDIRNDEIILELSAIAVKRENQRQRVGRRLLEISLSEVKTQWFNEGFKITGLLIETLEDEKGAQAFYEKISPSFQKKVFENALGDKTGVILYFIPLSDQ